MQLSLRVAQYLVEHPEAILGCLFGFAFFSPDYVEPMNDVERDFEWLSKAAHNFFTVQTTVATAALAVGLRSFFKEITPLLKTYYDTDMNESYAKMFRCVEAARQYEANRFPYAEQHMGEPGFLRHQPENVDIAQELAAEVELSLIHI